jgi:hypothetical protein
MMLLCSYFKKLSYHILTSYFLRIKRFSKTQIIRKITFLFLTFFFRKINLISPVHSTPAYDEVFFASYSLVNVRASVRLDHRQGYEIVGIKNFVIRSYLSSKLCNKTKLTKTKVLL